MFTKKIVTISILTIAAIALLMYPSINQSQVKSDNDENQTIAIQKATGLTNIHRISATPELLNRYFEKKTAESINSQNGYTGIQLYCGKQENGSSAFVITGTNRTGNVMIAGIAWAKCPPLCGA